MWCGADCDVTLIYPTLSQSPRRLSQDRTHMPTEQYDTIRLRETLSRRFKVISVVGRLFPGGPGAFATAPSALKGVSSRNPHSFFELARHSPYSLRHIPTSLKPLKTARLAQGKLCARYENSEAVPHHLTVASHDRRAARLLRHCVDCTSARPSTY